MENFTEVNRDDEFANGTKSDGDRQDKTPSSKSKAHNNMDTVGMRQDMSLWGGISFIVGTMIGSGIFISPKGVLRGAGSVGLSLIVWTLGGAVSMIGAACYIELGTMITKSGGEYAYFRESYHQVIGYLFSIVNSFLIRPAGTAAISMTCAQYLTVMFFDDGCGEPPDHILKCLTATIVLTVAMINYYSVNWAIQVQIFFTIAKIFALIIIIIGGIVKLIQGYTDYLSGSAAWDWVDEPATVGSVALGFYSSMWAYDGWNNLNMVVEELRDPQRNVPLGLCIGIPFVTVVYVLANISYFTVLSPQDLLDSPAVAISWADEVMPNFSWLLPLFVAFSTFGAANGSMFTAGRLMFVTSREGHMVKILSYVHAMNRTPAPAVVFYSSLAIIFMLPANIQTLIDFVNFTMWIFYGLTFASLIYLRYKKPELPRPFKVPIVLPIIAIIISIYLVLAPIIDEPQVAYLFSLVCFGVALVFYFPFVHYKKEIPGMAKFNTVVQLFLQAAPPPHFEMDGVVDEMFVPVEKQNKVFPESLQLEN